MKICIFGAGAIGGHLAAKLARAGADVSIIARGPFVEAVRRQGLRLISPTGDFTVAVKAAVDPAELPPQDLVISTAKAHSLPPAVDVLHTLARGDTPIVYVLNGIPWWYFYRNTIGKPERTIDRLDPHGELWNGVGVERAIGGVAYSSNEVIEPGTVRNTSNNRFVFGEPGGDRSPRLEAILAAVSSADIGGEATDDIRTEVWRKLLGNMATSPLGCITRMTTNEIVENDGLRSLFGDLIAEGIAVAAAYGVRLQANLADRYERMKQVRHRTSMLQDLEAGRKLEVDAQLLTVQDFARAAGVPTPTLDILVKLLLAVAEERAAA